MGKDRKVEMELDLQKLLQAYLHKWWLIVVCAVLAASITWVFTANFVTPLYKATVTIYVNNAKSDEQMDIITNTNLVTSVRLVNTYINMIRSNTVLEAVAATPEVTLSAQEIRAAMSAAQVSETELFNVTITHADPETAAQVANAVAEVAPVKIADFVEGSSTKIIDYAKVPTAPSSPDIGKNCVLGALIGCVIALLYVTLRFLLDVRIKDEEDLAMLFDLPVLAQIPAFIPQGAIRRGGYGKGKYGYHHSGYHNADKKEAE